MKNPFKNEYGTVGDHWFIIGVASLILTVSIGLYFMFAIPEATYKARVYNRITGDHMTTTEALWVHPKIIVVLVKQKQLP